MTSNITTRQNCWSKMCCQCCLEILAPTRPSVTLKNCGLSCQSWPQWFLPLLTHSHEQQQRANTVCKSQDVRILEIIRVRLKSHPSLSSKYCQCGLLNIFLMGFLLQQGREKVFFMWQQGRGSRWYHGTVARAMLLQQNKQTRAAAFMLWTSLVTSSCTQITHVAYSARAKVLFWTRWLQHISTFQQRMFLTRDCSVSTFVHMTPLDIFKEPTGELPVVVLRTKQVFKAQTWSFPNPKQVFFCA